MSRCLQYFARLTRGKSFMPVTWLYLSELVMSKLKLLRLVIAGVGILLHQVFRGNTKCEMLSH